MSGPANSTAPALAAGSAVPPLERTITLVDMVAYAGATWDFYRSHYDPAFVAAARLPAPIVDGQVFGALLVEQLQDWLGPQSFVHELAFTFKNLVFAGETVRCEGTVTEVAEDLLSAELRVVVIGEDGEAARVAVAGGRALVLLGTPDGPSSVEVPSVSEASKPRGVLGGVSRGTSSPPQPAMSRAGVVSSGEVPSVSEATKPRDPSSGEASTPSEARS